LPAVTKLNNDRRVAASGARFQLSINAMKPMSIQLEESVLRWVLKRLHYPRDVMLLCVRWYAAYPLSVLNLEEMMAERGVEVDHSTVHRWALKILSVLAKVLRRRKRPVGRSWRMDETYIRVGKQWKYLYRAVDKLGHTVDFLLTAKRDHAAARRFFERAIGLHDVPEKITIDKSGANTEAVHSMVADSGVEIELRQSKYLNNLYECLFPQPLLAAEYPSDLSSNSASR
jgi:transposase-like protein